MLVLVLGLVLFLGTHAFTMARGPRAALMRRLGEGGYKGLYSLLSLAGLILIGRGYDLYRRNDWIDVWHPPVWTRHFALTLVLVAFVLVVAAYLPGHIKARLKHPMLAGIKVWATAHLLANGDLGSMLMFGSILAWAVASRISVKRRERAVAAGVGRVGGEGLPDEAAAHGPEAAPGGWRNDALAVGVGALAWFTFAYWLHPLLIGVAVWPTRT